MQPEIFQIFRLPRPTTISQLAGGANNRVFKLEFTDQPPLVYKQYFQHPNDHRPRLQSEFSFLEYAWKLGIRNVPQPIQAELSVYGALYSYLPGRSVNPTEISDALIEQKIAFLLSLNQQKTSALHLPKASEACFSVGDFLQITENRIDWLLKIPIESPIEKDLKLFIENALLPAWNKLKERTCKTVLHSNLSSVEQIKREDQCVTPSDFGFHNTLIDENQNLSFLDFEYAGWDDPCKTISDFFCQPRIPIPEKYFLPFAEGLSSLSTHPESFFRRLQIVWPIIQMKWCCILLNTFTQVGKNRRMFSHSDELDRQEKQLRLAKEQLYKIQI